MTRARVTAGIIAAVVCGTLGLTGTLDLAHCVILAVVTVAIATVWVQPLPDIPRLPVLPRHSHVGSRRDVSALSWMVFDRDARLTRAASDRIRRLAEDGNQFAGVRQDMAAHPNPSPARIRRWLDSLTKEASHDPTPAPRRDMSARNDHS